MKVLDLYSDTQYNSGCVVLRNNIFLFKHIIRLKELTFLFFIMQFSKFRNPEAMYLEEITLGILFSINIFNFCLPQVLEESVVMLGEINLITRYSIVHMHKWSDNIRSCSLQEKFMVVRLSLPEE